MKLIESGIRFGIDIRSSGAPVGAYIEGARGYVDSTVIVYQEDNRGRITTTDLQTQRLKPTENYIRLENPDYDYTAVRCAASDPLVITDVYPTQKTDITLIDRETNNKTVLELTGTTDPFVRLNGRRVTAYRSRELLEKIRPNTD